MSIRSAVVLCRDKVSQSIGAATPKEKTAYSNEAEFALTILAEAMEDCECGATEPECDWNGSDYRDSATIEELDGVSTDENPEDETKEEKRERETARGFFG